MKLILTLSFSLFLFTKAYSQTVLAEHHFESGNITEVTVMGAFCDVDVLKGEKVIFDGRITGSGEKDDFIIASVKNGDKVLFKVESKSNNWWNGNSIKEARFEITVPDNVRLKVDNTSGDVRVEGLSGASYQIEATSGDIEVRTLTGGARIKSTSGDVAIRNLMGDVTSRSTSGDQRLTEVMGGLNVQTTSGNIELHGVEGELTAAATSGDIEIEQLKGAVSIETTSGNIEADDINLTENSNVKATSGDITFNFINNLEDIGFDLKASSGSLEVGSILGEDQLTLRRGSVQFTGVTTSGDQEYND